MLLKQPVPPPRNPTLDLIAGTAPARAAGGGAARGPAAAIPTVPEGATVLLPSEVLYRAKRNVEHMAKDGELFVEGELWDKKLTKGGHWTFDLKDPKGALPCIMFFNDTKRVGFELKQGMKVVVSGKPTVTFARVQLQVARIIPGDGIGALELAFQQLKEKLEAEGLFSPERKRPLPFLPRAVGVVTSSTGAALHDVVKVLRQRMPGLRIIVSPTKVQGEGASSEIGDALRRLDQSGLVDVILLVRGGGSLEDLWAFNQEPVARAIFHAKTPVISGVGHQTDTTIADFVADKRAATPSNAAELAVPRHDQLELTLAHHEKRLAGLLRHALSDARVRLDKHRKRLVDPRHLVERRRSAVRDLEQRLERALRKKRELERARVRKLEEKLAKLSPARQVAERRARLAALEARLAPAVKARRDKHARLLEVLVARLSSISPLTVLARGYAIARRLDDGRVVRAPEDAPPGTKLEVKVEKGSVKATVTDE